MFMDHFFFTFWIMLLIMHHFYGAQAQLVEHDVLVIINYKKKPMHHFFL